MIFGRIKKEDFHYIVDRMQSELAGWKSCLLNKAGKITLAKAILSSISIYTMQICWRPTSVCDSIDATIWRFIW